MATMPATELQAKVFQILSTDPIIAAQCSVYDHAPDGESVYPYIQIGQDEFDDFGSHEVDGFIVNITLHVWSRAAGKRQCKLIQERLYELLHNTDLALALYKTISLRAGVQTCMLDPDGRTYHGVSIFKLILGGS